MVSLKNICEQNGNIRQCAIVNANHEKVLSVLDGILQDDRYAFCRCDKCLNDIAALALNYLPPHYYVDAGSGGDIGSPSVMVEHAVLEAMDLVGKNPRHQNT
ncbi:MAG: late competence development ComFB family protein [Nitrospirota bacterium]